MEDFIESLKDFSSAAAERLKFPLVSSFILSWIVLNWKPIFIILFSEHSIEGRIAHIENFYSNPLYYMILPAGIALAYVIGIPYLKRELHKCIEEVSKSNREDAYDYHISSYEKRIIVAQKETELELIKSGNLDLNQLNQKVTTLTSEIEKVKNENIELLDTVKVLNEQIVDKDNEIRNIRDDMSDIFIHCDNDLARMETLLNKYQGIIYQAFTAFNNLDFNNDEFNTLKESIDSLSVAKETLDKEYKNFQFTMNSMHLRRSRPSAK